MCNSKRNYAIHAAAMAPAGMPVLPSACGCHYTRRGRVRLCFAHRHGIFSTPVDPAYMATRANNAALSAATGAAQDAAAYQNGFSQGYAHGANQRRSGPVGLLISGVVQGVKYSNRKVQEHREAKRVPESAQEKNEKRAVEVSDEYDSEDEVERREWEQHLADRARESEQQPPQYESVVKN